MSHVPRLHIVSFLLILLLVGLHTSAGFCTTATSSFDASARIALVSAVEQENSQLLSVRVEQPALSNEILLPAERSWEEELLAEAQELGGWPELSELVRIAWRGEYRLAITDLQFSEETLLAGSPWRGCLDLVPEEYQGKDAWYPAVPLRLGNAAILHDVRLAPLHTSPIQVNPVRGVVRELVDASFSLQNTGRSGLNELPQPSGSLDRSFLPLYRELLNWTENELDEEIAAESRRMVVVMRDDDVLRAGFAQWFEWKRQKGWQILFLMDSQVNWTATGIRNGLINMYNSPGMGFSYVVLLGDASGSWAIPAGSGGAIHGDGDHLYSCLAGDDNLPDVHLGRISVENISQVTAYKNKVLFYEQTPYTDETEWYTRGLVVSNSDVSGVSTIYLNRYLRHMMMDAGYTQVDTIWYNDGGGNVIERAAEILSQGVSFFQFRGLIGTGFTEPDIPGIDNDRKLPVIADITCSTGDFAEGLSISEAWMRAGTVSQPRGGIAAWGMATAATLTRFNNALCIGLDQAAFQTKLATIGELGTAGKLNMWRQFSAYENAHVDEFLQWFNLMGDPTVVFFSGIPQEPIITCPDTLYSEINGFPITVATQDGPVAGAWVCRYQMDGEALHTAFGVTGDDGTVVIPGSGGDYGEEVTFTITAKNLETWQHDFTVHSASMALRASTGSWTDDPGIEQYIGDNDGVIDAGEIGGLRFNITNTADAAQDNITIQVYADDPNLTVIDTAAVLAFRSIGAGATVASPEFQIAVSGYTPDEYLATIHVVVSSTQGQWEHTLVLRIKAPTLAVESVETDQPLLPGQTSALSVQLYNYGSDDATGGEISLSSLTPFLVVANGTATCAAIDTSEALTVTGFQVQAVDEAYSNGSIAELQLVYLGSNGVVDTILTGVTIGELAEEDPVGPDAYGYYAFENVDTAYDLAPVYAWVEINPNVEHHDYEGTALDLPDTARELQHAVVRQLPFTVQYYSETFTEITVAANGFAAMGSQADLPCLQNWSIPSPGGPNAMIAPFWDDRTVFDGAGVYDYHDTANGRYIIEWYQVTDLDSINPCTFQLILYDQVEGHETATGDADILFQYSSLNPSTSSDPEGVDWWTTGIENSTQNLGIQIAYRHFAMAGTAMIDSGRAILFTTNTWDNIHPVETDIEEALPRDYALDAPYPNPFNSETVIRYALPRSERINLSVFNVLGQRMSTMVQGMQEAGYHTLTLDANGWPSGVYFVQLKTAGGFASAQKVMLIK